MADRRNAVIDFKGTIYAISKGVVYQFIEHDWLVIETLPEGLFVKNKNELWLKTPCNCDTKVLFAKGCQCNGC